MKFIFWIVLLIYFVIQYLTLSYSPLPWFDETFYASIAKSFIETGELTPKVAIFKPEKMYGFVYFALTGFSLQTFGFGIWQFRIVNVFAGLTCILLTYKLLRILHPKISFKKSRFLILLIALDPFFYLCLHEAKADMTAIALMLSGLYFWLIFLKSNHNKTYLFLSAFCIAFALLSNPRAGLILLGIGFIFFIQIFQQKLWWNFILWCFLIVGIYAVWILYAFGGLQGFINHYFYQDFYFQNRPILQTYFGGKGYVPRQEYLLICCAVLSIVYGILFKRMAYFNPLRIIALLSIGLFYVLVVDFGQYSIVILFFYYLLLFDALHFKKIQFRNPVVYLVLLLWIQNITYFGLKNVQVFASLKQRDYKIADEFVRQHIPKHSKVVGEPMYFYSVLKSESDFQYMNYLEDLEDREKRQREVYQYDYLIVTDHLAWREPQTVKHYFEKGNLKVVARLELLPNELTKKINAFPYISSIERTGYSCTIYQHIKNK